MPSSFTAKLDRRFFANLQKFRYLLAHFPLLERRLEGHPGGVEVEAIALQARMDRDEPLYLGYERIDLLELRVGLARRRLVDLGRPADGGDEGVVAEGPVVDDGRAFGYVPAVRLEALEGADVPLPGDLGVALPLPVGGAGDDDLVPRDPLGFLPSGLRHIRPSLTGMSFSSIQTSPERTAPSRILLAAV